MQAGMCAPPRSRSLAWRLQCTERMMIDKHALRSRVESKRKLLEMRLSQIRVNAHAKEERKRLQSKLDELEEALEEGWEHLSEKGARKVESWL